MATGSDKYGPPASVYSGELAEPIPRPMGGLLGPGPAECERLDEAARRQKMPALFAHFGIDPNAADAWQRLATALAAVHVPGFQVQAPLFDPGAPLWNPLGFGIGLPSIPMKRGRGRPRKLPKYTGRGLLGLLSEAHEGERRRPGRPLEVTMQEKAHAVQWFDSRKRAKGLTDIGTAEDILQHVDPGLNRYSRKREAEKFARQIVRWRPQVKRLGNS